MDRDKRQSFHGHARRRQCYRNGGYRRRRQRHPRTNSTMKTKFALTLILIVGTFAALADWKVGKDIGANRTNITHGDGTLVATMEALVDLEDYPKEWFASRIVAAHNAELDALYFGIDPKAIIKADQTACAHEFEPWYLQTSMDALAEQPAHRCKKCRYWQNAGGYWSETKALRESDPTFWPKVEAQMKKDIGTSKARDGFTYPNPADEENAKAEAARVKATERKFSGNDGRNQITVRLHAAFLADAEADKLFEILLSTTDKAKFTETLGIIKSMRERSETLRETALIMTEHIFEAEVAPEPK